MKQHEWAYIRWYARTHRSHVLIIMSIMFVIFSIGTFMFPGNENSGYIPLVIPSIILPIIMILMAFVLAIYNFRFHFKKRYHDMIRAIPIKKSHFFIIQYTFGLLVLWILPILGYGFTMLIDKTSFLYIKEYSTYLIFVVLLSTALYSMYVYFVIKCNTLWDAIIICIGYSLLPILVVAAMYMMIRVSLSNLIVSQYVNVNEVFSMSLLAQLFSIPITIAYLGSNTFTKVYDMMLSNEATQEVNALRVENLYLIWFWVCAGIFFFFLARRAYLSYKEEDSEQRTKAWVCYPFIILLITISMLLVSYMDIMNGASNYSFFVMTLIAFFIMSFFSQRRIKVTLQMIITFFAMCIAVVSISYLFTFTKGFGSIQEYPDEEQIKEVSVSLQYVFEEQVFTFKEPQYRELNELKLSYIYMKSSVDEKAIINRVFDYQKEFVNANSFDELLGEISIIYKLKNEKVIERSYPIQNYKLNKQVIEFMEEVVDEGYVECEFYGMDMDEF